MAPPKNGERPDDLGPVVFTPDNEPYLGRESVFDFDRTITSLIEQQHKIAAWTRANRPTRLQAAASQLVPGACSIALSIRELIRQGYLFSAMILLRPLVERVATLSYLTEHPDGLGSWESGWKHGSRPTFQELLSTMESGIGAQKASDELKLVARRYHSLVHGDPAAASETLIALSDGTMGLTVAKDLTSPERADAVAFEATMYLVVLMVRSIEVFPQRDVAESVLPVIQRIRSKLAGMRPEDPNE